MILSLPNELIGKICNEVDRLEDKKNLQRTCSRLGRALRPHVLSEVSLNIHKHNLKPGLNLLHALVHQKEVYSPHIRTLYIDSLSPTFFPNPEFARKQELAKHTWELFEMVRGWVSDPIDDRNPEIVKAHTTLKTLLDPALRTLHNLETVHWHWHWKDSEWTLQTIMESLSSLNGIKSFSFSSTPHVSRPAEVWHNPFTQLPNFSNLHVLSISILTEGNTNASLRNSAPAIILPLMTHLLSRTTSLSHLHLDTGISSSSCPSFPFDDISQASNTTLLSSITHLSIGGWSIDILPDIPIHFPNLTSLSVRIGRRSGHGLKWLFDSLSFNDIRLRSIVFDKFTEDMLDYISSYSGIETLSFIGPNWYSERPEYGFTAERFYGEILGLHRDSLVKLEVLPTFEGEWCFGEDNLEAIGRCEKLRYLGVRLRSAGIYVDPNFDLWFFEQLTNESTPNLVYTLLDMINTNLPHLQSLHIDSPHFGDSSTRSGTKYCRGVRKGIRKSLEAVCDPCIEENAVRRGVLRWVKVYVAGERFEFESMGSSDNSCAAAIAIERDQARRGGGRGGGSLKRKSIGSRLKAITARMSWRLTG
ncbi:hypothetical protein K435DRAFT_965385 [Dendrothele bispora CBS 962.96]|uniref:F-box domain-containing protein n=1 Tax=Dendrothele bispora (strain CBS 962.96) TaxID=1314807 RepID=A0A4S8M651_DENBC|nr:hypothetical protein K435DRAFT_965385 [Dendrothele bispora CBS 962.96]